MHDYLNIEIPKEYHLFVKSQSNKKLSGLKVHFTTSDINIAKANIKYIKSKKWKSVLTYDEFYGVYQVWTDHSFVPIDYTPKSVVETGKF
jgi:hypothetical protein